MSQGINRLSPAQVKHAEPGLHPDGGGLYLQVTEGKEKGKVNKSWLFRYRRPGRERQMGLGSLKTIGLSEARDEAERCRKLLKDGKDPIETRQAEKAKAAVANAKIMTFHECALAYMAAHEGGWRNAKQRRAG
jgi:hypothetical protein